MRCAFKETKRTKNHEACNEEKLALIFNQYSLRSIMDTNNAIALQTYAEAISTKQEEKRSHHSERENIVKKTKTKC